MSIGSFRDLRTILPIQKSAREMLLGKIKFLSFSNSRSWGIQAPGIRRIYFDFEPNGKAYPIEAVIP